MPAIPGAPTNDRSNVMDIDYGWLFKIDFDMVVTGCMKNVYTDAEP